MRPSRSLVIGVGNPFLADDGVGIRIARELRDRLSGRSDIDVIELYTGGIRLMEEMTGYDRAVVVDAMITGLCPPGTVRQFSLPELVHTRHSLSTHDTDLATALMVGKTLGIPLPGNVSVWAVEARDVDVFSEKLTSPVAEAVPAVIELILNELGISGEVRT